MGKTSRRKRAVQDAAQDEIVVEDERLKRRAPPLMLSMDGCMRLGGATRPLSAAHNHVVLIYSYRLLL